MVFLNIVGKFPGNNFKVGKSIGNLGTGKFVKNRKKGKIRKKADKKITKNQEKWCKKRAKNRKTRKNGEKLKKENGHENGEN